MPDRIPAAFVPVALAAVASRDRRLMLEVATQLGLSVPAMAQACLRLAREPQAVSANPRVCRVILSRVDRSR